MRRWSTGQPQRTEAAGRGRTGTGEQEPPAGLLAELLARRGEFVLGAGCRIRDGEVLAVLGPNGSGKSTLLDALTGTIRPQRGTIRLADRTWLDTDSGVDVPTHRRGVGLLAQQALLFPHLSVLDNVAFGPRSTGHGKRASREIARRWLSEVGAAGFAERKPGQLSGGQAQRVALARAMAADPALLLLDEPLAALDVDAAPAMRGLLHRVLPTQNRPVVLVTHDALDALVLSDRVLVLSGGSVVESGPTRRVLSRPQSPFTARIAGLNLLGGTSCDGGVRVGDTVVSGRIAEPLAAGVPAAAVFVPSAVAVHRQWPQGSPRNTLEVRLTGIEPRGDVIRLRAVASEGADPVLAADVTPAALADLRLATGETVFFTVKAAEVALHPVSGGSSES